MFEFKNKIKQTQPCPPPSMASSKSLLFPSTHPTLASVNSSSIYYSLFLTGLSQISFVNIICTSNCCLSPKQCHHYVTASMQTNQLICTLKSHFFHVVTVSTILYPCEAESHKPSQADIFSAKLFSVFKLLFVT